MTLYILTIVIILSILVFDIIMITSIVQHHRHRGSQITFASIITVASVACLCLVIIGSQPVLVHHDTELTPLAQAVRDNDTAHVPDEAYVLTTDKKAAYQYLPKGSVLTTTENTGLVLDIQNRKTPTIETVSCHAQWEFFEFLVNCPLQLPQPTLHVPKKNIVEHDFLLPVMLTTSATSHRA